MEFETWCRKQFADLGIQPPADLKCWIPTLEDYLDTDVGCLAAMQGVNIGEE